MSEGHVQTEGLGAEALRLFEDHLPLLERVVSQVLVAATASVRDMVYLGAVVLLNAAAEWEAESSVLSFKEYAEVLVTSELLHFAHYPVPVIRLPSELAPFGRRLDAMAQALACPACPQHLWPSRLTPPWPSAARACWRPPATFSPCKPRRIPPGRRGRLGRGSGGSLPSARR